MYISAINANPALKLNKKNELNNHYSNYAVSQEQGTKLEDSLNGIARINQLAVSKSIPSIHISFTGNQDKNYNQFSYLTAENKSVGHYELNEKTGKYDFKPATMYNAGGEGVVVSEASTNWSKGYDTNGNIDEARRADVRTFQPYHSANNEDGKISLLTKNENGETIFKQVETSYQLNKGQGEKFVILLEPDKNGKHNYIPLEETSIQGNIKKVDENFKLNEIKYKLYKMEESGKNGNPTHYFIHVPDAAAYSAAYDNKSAYRQQRLLDIKKATGEANLTYNGDDYVYSQVARAYADIHPKMNTEEFGFYNPANHWLHDRQAFPALIELAERSASGDEYFNGIKMHDSFHNPGRSYQGIKDDPTEFFRIVASEADYNALKENKSNFDFVKKMSDKITTEKWKYSEKVNKRKALELKLKTGKEPLLPEEALELKDLKEKFAKEGLETKDILDKKDLERLYDIMDPVIGGFKDEKGYYNICKIPVHGVRTNPFNTSAGSVSKYFGKEMKDSNTPEIAEGLTSDLASIPTHDIVNGSTPANMATNVIGNFGPKDCKFNTDEIKNGYTPFGPKLDAEGNITNIDEIFNAKKKNTKWAIDTVADATKQGQDALNELFFDKASLDMHSNVLGGLSEHKAGDVLLIGWGRPDPQKGFPTTLEAMLHFFKREDVPTSEKLKVKLLFGAGSPNPWNKDHPDWKDIQTLMKEIAELDGGTYKGNVCYVNGYFPNRLANASTSGFFTSVFEPCGITPLESYAAGNPVLSIRTGGAPDFVKEILNKEIIDMEAKGASKETIIQYLEARTGFLTEHAFLVKPQVIGQDAALADTEELKALTQARRKALGAELSDCVKDFLKITNDDSLLKAVMNNVLKEKTDWHNNNKYNGGKSANQRYFNEVFEVTDDFKPITPRNQSPLKNLKGQFKKPASYITQALEDSTKGSYDEIRRTLNVTTKSFLASKTGKVVAFASGLVATCGVLAYYKNPKVKTFLTPKNSLAAVAPASNSAQNATPTSVIA